MITIITHTLAVIAGAILLFALSFAAGAELALFTTR